MSAVPSQEHPTMATLTTMPSKTTSKRPTAWPSDTHQAPRCFIATQLPSSNHGTQ